MARKQIDPRLVEILKQYHPDPKAAVWDCHGTWCAYHKDIELIAAKAGVTLDPPVIVEMNSEKKIAVVCVTGRLGDRVVWSFGEAAPHNNKNAYPVSMAEKRAVDRVVLKLVGLHGFVYSDQEIDEEEMAKEAKRKAGRYQNQQQEPEPEPAQEYTEEEQAYVQDNKQKLIEIIKSAKTIAELEDFATSYSETISLHSDADIADIRKEYSEQKRKVS